LPGDFSGALPGFVPRSHVRIAIHAATDACVDTKRNGERVDDESLAYVQGAEVVVNVSILVASRAFAPLLSDFLSRPTQDDAPTPPTSPLRFNGTAPLNSVSGSNAFVRADALHRAVN
jgi:hypothetical protein